MEITTTLAGLQVYPQQNHGQWKEVLEVLQEELPSYRLTSEGVEVTKQTNGHNHSIDGVEAQVERVKHNLRKRAREEFTPIPSIYNDVLVDIATKCEENEALAGSLPTFPSLKSSLCRSRRSRLPPLPQSQEDIQIESRWQKTLSGEQFLLRQEGDVHIFSTNENLCLLATAESNNIC